MHHTICRGATVTIVDHSNQSIGRQEDISHSLHVKAVPCGNVLLAAGFITLSSVLYPSLVSPHLHCVRSTQPRLLDFGAGR